MQQRGFQPGEYERTFLEETFAVSSTIYNGSPHLGEMNPGYQIQALLLQLKLNVAMSGGNLAATEVDKLIDLITEFSMSLDGEYIYEGLTGADLADIMRNTAPFGDEFYSWVDPISPPTDGNNADVKVNIMLLGPDCRYEGGARNHSWPSDLLRKLKFKLVTGAASLVNDSATITGTVAIRAIGKKGGDMLLAPMPHFEKHDGQTNHIELHDPEKVIRNLFAVDRSNQFSTVATEKDQLKIDKEEWYDTNRTIQDMLDTMNLRRRIAAGGSLNFEATTGTQIGVTDTYYPHTDYLEYIGARGDLGDSPVHQAKYIRLKMQSARNLCVWSYKKIDSKWIQKVRKLIKKPIGAVQKIGFGPGNFQDAEDLARLGTVLPVRIGHHSEPGDPED